jgi:hypothetical protein
VFAREGRVFAGTIADTIRRQLLGSTAPARAAAATEAPADTSAAARTQRAKERFSVTRWSPAGDAILASNSEGFWIVDVASGAKGDGPCAFRFHFDGTSPAAAGVEPRRPLPLLQRELTDRMESRHRAVRPAIEAEDRAGSREEVLQRPQVSDDGSTAVLSIADGNRVADLYVTDAVLSAPRRVIDANPQLARKPLPGTELISYLDADGRNQYGVLHYPVGYQKGTRYPTVFLIYEDYFDDTWDVVANLLAARGFAVVKPSVSFEIGYPGEAWLKGVTAAANAVIQMGVAGQRAARACRARVTVATPRTC